jgi:hypothetical protein
MKEIVVKQITTDQMDAKRPLRLETDPPHKDGGAMVVRRSLTVNGSDGAGFTVYGAVEVHIKI